MLRALVSAFAIALFISPAHAQLGALKKRAEKAETSLFPTHLSRLNT